jgi:uncharacterized protein YaiE (UPF0345 family)
MALTWVGELHHQMLLAFMSDPVLRKPRRERKAQDLCPALARIIAEGATIADNVLGRSRTDVEKADEVGDILATVPRCWSPSLSIFSMPGARATHHSVVEAVEDTVIDGSFETYLEDLVDAVDATDGSVYAVSQAAEGVLYAAAGQGLLDGDLTVIAGAVDLVISSAQDWNSYDWPSSGVPPDECLYQIIPEEGCEEWLQSIFGSFPRRWDWFDTIHNAILVDDVACVTAGIATWKALPLVTKFTSAGVEAALAACVIWGLGSSAAYLVGF